MDSIHLPQAIALPTAFGAPGTPLPVGQVVQALVLELIESDVFRLQLPQATIDVRSEVPLAVGSAVTLAVKGAGPNARLVIYADEARAPIASAQAAQPQQAAQPSQAAPAVPGKRLIGEAVVIARGPVQTGRAQVEQSLAVRDLPPVAPPRTAPVTPERALGEAVRAAAVRQSGLAPLFADVEQVAQSAPNAVPAPVRAAAQNVAALRVPLDANLTGADVKQAFVRSGVLLEPRVAAGRIAATVATPAGNAPSNTAGTAPPVPDLKAALLVLRQVVKVWAQETAPAHIAPSAAPPIAPERTEAPRPSLPLPDPIVRQAAPASDRPATPPVAPSVPEPDAPTRPFPLSDASTIRHLANALAGATDEVPPQAPPLSPEQATTLAKSVASQLGPREAPDHPASAAPNGAPPLPYRGAPLAGQQPVAAALTADMPPHERAERLLTDTDGALARTTLLQAASLPDQPAQRSEQAAQRWTFEVPFATPQGTAVAQFEVSRDPQAAKSDRTLPVWRARFSLDVEPMGPVHALVALAGERASVTLWAERHATAARLNDNAAMLGDALRAAELEPADFLFRVGAPPSAARQAAPGRFMDRAT